VILFVVDIVHHPDERVFVHLVAYARWHMFEEKREAVLAIEAAVLPLMT
jgi:hypothetical protein